MSHRVLFYGNFGAGNLGNECTLEAALEKTREHAPDAQFECLCTHPADVRARHGIVAFRSDSKRFEWSIERSQATATAGTVPGPDAMQGETGLPPSSGAAELHPPQIPGEARRRKGIARRLASILFRRIPSEIVHWLACFRIVRGSRMLIVPGTQIVSDYLCSPLDWPYDIFKFSVLSALCRAKLVFLSVGVGPVRHPLSRWFIRRSLSLADYRSYRDDYSKEYARRIGFDSSRDPVYPDLVWGLAPRHFAIALAAAASRSGVERVIGIGLKDYSGPVDRASVAGYRAYLEAMADFVEWLCDRSYSVRLLIGDVQYDTLVRQDLLELLRKRGRVADRLRVIAEPALTGTELLRQLAETDAVVSPRFHNLILALMLEKPVICLSDHAKLDSLMSGLGLSRYCQPLDELGATNLIALFEELRADTDRLRPLIRSAVDEYREALERQYFEYASS